jgi:hypothetical protein
MQGRRVLFCYDYATVYSLPVMPVFDKLLLPERNKQILPGLL